jgi:dethiobiotin synthetase
VSTVLVSGTDTGIGKTFVSCVIAAGLRARGVRVGVAKPIETGCEGDRAEDGHALAAAANSDEPVDAVCARRFADPLAPLLAAERAGAAIDVAALVGELRTRAARHQILLVEGAGGLLVPLTPVVSFAELAAALGAPVLLVVGSRLGAINHALLTLEVLATRGLSICGYVLNRVAPPGDLAADTNGALLARLTRVPCLGELPWVEDAPAALRALGGTRATEARARLAELARQHLDLDAVVAGAERT